MHCNSCVMLVKEALEDEGAKDVNVELNQKEQLGRVALQSDKSRVDLIKTIEAQGDYKVE